MPDIYTNILEKIVGLTTDIEELRNKTKDIVIAQKFYVIVKETKNRKKWFEEGKCYHCGGSVELKFKESGILSEFICQSCFKSVYTDVHYEYYFKPIINSLLELYEEINEDKNAGKKKF